MTGPAAAAGRAPIRLVYVMDELVHAGAGTERQVLHLLGGLDRARFAPELVCLRPSPWLEGRDLGVPVRVLGVAKLRSLHAFAALRRFARWLRDEDVAIVQTFFPDAGIFGTLAARRARTPVVVASRRNLGHDNTAFDWRVLRWLRRCTTHYLANSQAAARVAVEREGADPERVTVIYNGLDPRLFQPRAPAARARQRAAWGLDADALVVGCLANLRAVKNLDALLDATASLAADHPRLHVVVVGEGGERARLEGRIADSGLAGRFHLVGHLADVRPCLAAFDIGVLPSRAEGFSNAVCEYLASGLPTVVSDVGGNVEAVRDGETGLRFPPERSDVLAAHLRRLLEDAGLRRRLGEAARRDAEARFGLAASLRAHEAFYARVLAPETAAR